uniref:SGTA homodimerisation domain-containing protein n=1 Tax=Knipowitschia caucasica TaxID=637954 RepID=A0AAV2KT42_KNICA
MNNSDSVIDLRVSRAVSQVSSSPLPPHRALHPGIMSDTKRLAFSILRFLHDQLNSGTLTSDAKESLEVAVQCMETAYEISTDDQSLAVPMSLPEIFNAATAKFPAQSQANNNSSPNCLSDEDRAEAEALKTEGTQSSSWSPPHGHIPFNP